MHSSDNERELFSLSCMNILVTSRHLQPISRKEKRKLVNDIVILKLFASWGECERFFLLKKMPKIFTKLPKLFLKNFESKIREYAGQRMVNNECVTVHR